MTFIERLSGLYHSENSKLILCAACASFVTATTILSVQYGTKVTKAQESRRKWQADAAEEHEHIQLSSYGGQLHQKEPVNEEIIHEQLSRNYIFFGDAGMALIRRSFVIIVGVGGVGSWATVMLVRSGVGKVRIIDFDQVTLSSLNRHASATLEDVGTSKVSSLKKYLARVAPWIEVETRNELFRKADADELLQAWDGQSPDFVIDAIDNIETKADLLAYCHERNIPVIASMGAGCKSDPTRIMIADISMTEYDPLSRATRRHLKARGVHSGIPVVYSTEPPDPEKAQLKPIDPAVFEQGNVSDLGILPDFRARILPVLGTMPAIFGLTLATHVLCTLAKYPTTPIASKGKKGDLFKDLLAFAQEQNEVLPAKREDVIFLVDEISHGRSNLAPYETGKLGIVKWNPDKPLALSNLAVLTRVEAQKHNQAIFKERKRLGEVYSTSQLRDINIMQARFRQYWAWQQG